METAEDIVIGIDLGTTNSLAAYAKDGRIELVPIDGEPLLPSVVGLGPDDSVIVGRKARNQAVIYPERTVRSIKRLMGSDETISFGERSDTPVEISAMILRRIKKAAEEHLGCNVSRAVITVPAYFKDAQRTATKEAGEIAGFRVERIINEPTAAALCYAETSSQDDRTVMVYDLGGGTFDVSIVRLRGGITEVLSSHGDTTLGGDDFDEALLEHLSKLFQDEHGADPTASARSRARILQAVEEGKKTLSVESYAQVILEHIAEKEGVPLHLDMELSRPQLESVISPILSRTKDSVHSALSDAGISANRLDEVILVGGSTRAPLVGEMLESILKMVPRQDVNPDTAIVQGAALQAARIAGDSTARILVDVTPYSFGTSYLGELHGMPSSDCYRAVIKRNTPLPTRQTRIFYTAVDGQNAVDVHIFQGEDEDAKRNQLIGRFMVEGLDEDAQAGSPIEFSLNLDINGILDVEVREVRTGIKKRVTIKDAMRTLSDEDKADAQRKIAGAFGEKDLPQESSEPHKAFALPEDATDEEKNVFEDAIQCLEKAKQLGSQLEEEDASEVNELIAELETGLENKKLPAVKKTAQELTDVLFYLG